jgi:hypothetical protein
MFPVILAYVLIAADMRIDLSDLKPAQASTDESTTLIGWPELEAAGSARQWHARPRARMLGYMMDGYTPSRDGEPVKMFILLPEAGQVLHAAHRIPDQMVEIWLRHPAPFAFRRLVWVSGMLDRAPPRRDFDEALYTIKDASVESASDRDITRWFRPRSPAQ